MPAVADANPVPMCYALEVNSPLDRYMILLLMLGLLGGETGDFKRPNPPSVLEMMS